MFGLGDASILNAYRYPRLKLSESCMRSRSVAEVNNLSPDVDNANTALPRLHARFAPTMYVEYINTMSLLHLGNIIFGLSGSLVGWISPTGYHALSLALVTCRAPIVSSIAPVISANILDQVYVPSQAARFLLWSRSLHDQERYRLL